MQIFSKKKEWIFVLSLCLICTVVVFFYFQKNLEVAQSFPFPTGLRPIFLIMLIPIVAAINGLREELFYRLILLHGIKKQGLQTWTALVFSSLYFGAMHFHGGYPQIS